MSIEQLSEIPQINSLNARQYLQQHLFGDIQNGIRSLQKHVLSVGLIDRYLKDLE